MDSDYLYLKFEGPAANEGRLDIGKAGKSLLAIDKWTKIYKKSVNNDERIILRIGGVKQGSSELQVYFDLAKEIVSSPQGKMATIALFTQIPGIKDFLKGFGTKLGEQLALKMFAKGSNIRESESFAKNGEVYVTIYNNQGESKEVKKSSIDLYRDGQQALNNVYALEPGKEDKLEVGYFSANKYHRAAVITTKDKEAFTDYNDPAQLAKRMAEPFHENKSEEVKIIGQFVDFHGMAHRYKFSFQVRKSPEIYGKQKILCIVSENDISTILDLLKPENKKNVCVSGKATKDAEGKLDKIKIDWFNHDPEFNPEQTELMK